MVGSVQWSCRSQVKSCNLATHILSIGAVKKIKYTCSANLYPPVVGQMPWKMVMSSGYLNSVCIKCVHVHQNEISSDFPFMFVDSLEVSLSIMFHAQIKAVKSVIPFCPLKEWLVSYLSEKGSVVEPVEGTSAPEKMMKIWLQTSYESILPSSRFGFRTVELVKRNISAQILLPQLWLHLLLLVSWLRH